MNGERLFKVNRTEEFFVFLNRELPKNPSVSRQQIVRKASRFSELTSEIQSRLSHSSNSVATLRALVNNGNILGQDEQQIQELIIALNTDFGELMNKINEVEKLNNQQQDHAINVAQSLRQNLASITEEFKQIISQRSQAIAKRNERRKQTIGSISSTPMSFPSLYANSDEVEIPIQQVETIEQQRERYDMIRNVEQSVSDILQMFVQLSEIIAQHDYAIDRIDQNTQETVANMEKGYNQIVKYYDKIKGNKRLVYKIIAILLVFLIVFIIII